MGICLFPSEVDPAHDHAIGTQHLGISSAGFSTEVADSGDSLPQRLIRSVSSKLRRSWRQRPEIEAQAAGNVKLYGEGEPDDEVRESDVICADNNMRCFGFPSKSIRQASPYEFFEAVSRGARAHVSEMASERNVAEFAFAQDQVKGMTPCVGYVETLDFRIRKPLQEIAAPSFNGRTCRLLRPCGCFAHGSRLVDRRELDFEKHAPAIDESRDLSHTCGDKNEEAINMSRIGVSLCQSAGLAAAAEEKQSCDGRPSGRQQCGCFSNGGIERLKKDGSSRKGGKTGGKESSSLEIDWKDTIQEHPGLPDDVVEMCLARTPFSTLMRARLVCKKWRAIIMSPHFLASRELLSSRKPWLLVFGLSRDGVATGEIHCRDPTFDRWHTIQAKAISGRFLFSVASLNGLVYVIGGCSSSPDCQGRFNKSPVKTHKGVLVYNALTGIWSKVCSMGTARAMPVVHAFEMRGRQIVKGSSSSSSRRSFGSCRFSDVDVHGIVNSSDSARLHSRNRSCNQRILEGISDMYGPGKEDIWSSGYHNSSTKMEMDSIACDAAHLWGGSTKDVTTLGLIVVGGQGLWNQPLYSAELYDPFTNSWKEVAKLPADHGVTCAGVMCKGVFYVYSETDKLAAYDFDANVWTSIEVSNPLIRLREYMPKLVTCKGRIFLLGVAWNSSERDACHGVVGNGREKATRILWELNPSSQAWVEISSHPDAPLDWNAVFVSEGSQIYGLEMFKIFGQVLDFVTVCDFSESEVMWKRLSRIRIGNDLEVSSCITKTAVVVQL